MADKYQSVNGAWPETVPVPTAQEAVSGVKRLYRLVMKKPYRGEIKVVSGNRHTYIRYGVLQVNPNGRWSHGWKGVVHGLSHSCHRRLNPGHKPHDGRGTHAWIEKQMIEHVVNSGWLEGKLKRSKQTKPKPDIKLVRYQRTLAKFKIWQTKEKRAKTAIKKLSRQLAYYERVTNQQEGDRAL